MRPTEESLIAIAAGLAAAGQQVAQSQTAAIVAAGHTYLVVSTERTTLTLYKNGKVIFSTRVGTGKSSTPTPHGHFYIRDRLDGFPADSEYGPTAFGTSALSNVETDWPGGGVIGIHGTNEPSLIPGHPSHGCIRLPNWEIVKLAKLLPIGTPLTID